MDKPIIFSAPMIHALIAGRKTMTRRVLKPQPVREGNFWRWHGGGWNKGNPLLVPGHSMYERAPARPGDRLWVRETWQVVRETLDYETGYEFDVHDWDEQIFGNPRYHLNGQARDGIKSGVYYRADGKDKNPCHFYPLIGMDGKKMSLAEICWRSPIHMPRWASRLTLIVESVKVERVQDISEDDARAEGIYYVAPTPEDEQWYRDWCEENYTNPEIPIEGVWMAPCTRQGFGATKEARSREKWAPTPEQAFKMTWDFIHGPDSWNANPWVAAIGFRVVKENIDRILDGA